jgi:hypothetical protein
MLNSIKYFEENSIKIFENLETDFMKDPTKMAELVLGVTKEVHNLALKIIQDCLEDTDRLIRESVVRKNHWYVERYETKQLICSLGTVRFKKTLYTDKETGKGGVYLLDRVMDMDKHERFTEDAVANLLKEAVQTSYRKGGEAASLEDDVSKQAVMNKIHELEFPADTEPVPEKKTVEYLYIEADEDHIPKQFNEKKGDLARTENGFKNTSAKTKTVTVSWEKQATQTTGYEIQYATNSKFTKNKKTITVKGAKTASKTIKNLSSNKNYYVRIRTYKTVDGKKYYSAWSETQSVKTK